MPKQKQTVYDPLFTAHARGKPIRVKDCRAAAPGDLLTWLERIAYWQGSTPDVRDGLAESPKYLLRSRDRIRTELQRRMI